MLKSLALLRALRLLSAQDKLLLRNLIIVFPLPVGEGEGEGDCLGALPLRNDITWGAYLLTKLIQTCQRLDKEVQEGI